MAYLYILKLNDSTHYCGIARNLYKRVEQHFKGRSKSTRRKRPIVLKYAKEFESLLEARKMEVLIKSQGVTRWWIKNSSRKDNVISSTANSQQPTANT